MHIAQILANLSAADCSMHKRICVHPAERFLLLRKDFHALA